jgi:hypothetical protein
VLIVLIAVACSALALLGLSMCRLAALSDRARAVARTEPVIVRAPRPRMSARVESATEQASTERSLRAYREAS